MVTVSYNRFYRILKSNGFAGLCNSLLSKQNGIHCSCNVRNISAELVLPESGKLSTNFGLFFDIDGVITRGQTLLPQSKAAFKLLTDSSKRFRIPTIFVTNSGCTMRQSKADQLSKWLDIHVEAEQVIMSHSPLRMFKQFLNRHMLISGQGPIEEIARFLGFTNFSTLDSLKNSFPKLDTVDHRRRKAAPCAFEEYYPKIEGIVLFGEPVNWESSLQIIIDILLSDGRPSQVISQIPYPHLPILACNMDLVWMAEAPMPRFGHGCFIACLESLYKKLTNHNLQYTAKLGKPNEITYHHAERVLQDTAIKMGRPTIKRMYCIGDNPLTDIYGANQFNQRLQKLAATREKIKSSIDIVTKEEDELESFNVVNSDVKVKNVVYANNNNDLGNHSNDLGNHNNNNDKKNNNYNNNNNNNNIDRDENEKNNPEESTDDESLNVLPSTQPTARIEKCESILVSTGVFNKRLLSPHENQMSSEYMMSLCRPSFATVHNVLEAVEAVLEKESIL